MRKLLQTISLLALLMTFVPAIMYLGLSVELANVKLFMIIGTIVWFLATPLWMLKCKPVGESKTATDLHG